MKRLLAITEGPDFVCYRYRIGAFRDMLAERGWQLEVLPRAQSVGAFFQQLQTIAAADGVVLQRRLCGWARRTLIRWAAKVLIYDFDDAVFLRDSNCLKTAADASRFRRFRRTIRVADACFAGNNHLQERAVELAPNTNVHLMPTCVDPNRYRLAAHDSTGADVQLVWIGSRSTSASLVDAHAGLVAASQQTPGLTLKAISDYVPPLNNVRVLAKPWSNDTEAEEIAQSDIGIAWLPEHPWSLGKCGLKVLQYMAAGLPVVANRIGVHQQLVVHGETGFLANEPEEWGDAIAKLAHSPTLRREMGRAGRAHLVRHFSVQQWGPRFASLVDQLCCVENSAATVEAIAP
jgi:glycosyltransferase involved in cell wall biosynthesis